MPALSPLTSSAEKAWLCVWLCPPGPPSAQASAVTSPPGSVLTAVHSSSSPSRGDCHCRMLESAPPVTNLCRAIHASAATGPSCSRAHERWPAPSSDAGGCRPTPGSGRSPTKIEPSSKVAATCSPEGLMATASAISPPSLTMLAAHLWAFVGPSATERTAMWPPRYTGGSRVKAPASQSIVGGWRDLHVALAKVRWARSRRRDCMHASVCSPLNVHQHSTACSESSSQSSKQMTAESASVSATAHDCNVLPSAATVVMGQGCRL
eukprot:scaffold23655_cov65-Phaeocystis_antarctica.AAC.12